MATPLHDHIYFTRLELSNVKSFGEGQFVDLTRGDGIPARWTLIVGENNTGKTTLLQCLTRMRPDVANRSEGDTTGDSFLPELAAEEENERLDSLVRNGSDVECLIQAELVSGYNLDGRGGRPKQTILIAELARKQGKFAETRMSGRGPRRFKAPVLIAYGAGRHITLAQRNEELPDPTASLMDPSVELIDAEKVLQRLDYHVAKFKDRGASMRLRALKDVLANILPEVQRPEDIVINPPRTAGLGSVPHGVRVRTPHGLVPLDELSLGYRTVTAWVVDLAWRLFNAYPESVRPMSEPAIVIVDEIDLHLHPKWQRTIRKNLTNHFPNVQFIATAHSPLMAQDYLDQNLVLLRLDEDEGEVTIENEPSVVQDWSIDQLATSELFDLPSARSPTTSDAVQRRLRLLAKPELNADEEGELEALETRVSALGARTSEDEAVLRGVVSRTTAILRARPAG
jgi:energy-coupling factor transporter ATP-binding protein EcfA2